SRRHRRVGLRDAGRYSASQKLRGAIRGRALGRARDPRHRHLSTRRRLRGPAKPVDDGRRDRPFRLQRRCLPCSRPRADTGLACYRAGSRGLAGGRLRPAVPRRRTDMTPIRFSPSSLKEGRWYEYVVRFALGGAATIFTGLISSRYGASVGGLFLALPAIFCASATLIEKHEIRKKKEAGLAGERRGQQAAALDAIGAALGALGM